MILTSALGVGTATAVYSLVYAILLRPFPYHDPGQLVRVQTRHAKQGNALQGCSLLDIDDYRRRMTQLEDIGAYVAFETQLLGTGAGQVTTITQANPAAINILGVAPVVGRLFTAAEDLPGGDVHKALISHALWQSQYGSDPNVVGQPVRTDRMTYTIVGVMPPGFAFPQRTAIWTPMESYYATLTADRTPKRRDSRFYATVARLKPGVSLARAEADLNAVAEALEREYPKDNEGVRVKLTPLRELEVGELRPYLQLLMGGVALVVLICCANIAGLLLVRAAGQQTNVAIKAALGASRARMAADLLAESLVFALLGGIVGIGFAYAGVSALVALIPVQLPFWMTITIDRWVLAFSLLLTVASGVIFGLVPALQASRVDVNRALKSGGRGSSSRGALRRVLVVGEVALSLLLLVCAALLMQTLARLQQVDSGFRSDGLITARVIRYQAGTVRESAAVLNNMHTRILDALRRVPGVASVAVTNGLPYTGTRVERTPAPLTIKGRAETRTMAPLAGSDVSTDYFRTMHVALRRGRLFDPGDTITSAFVAIVNERGAKLLWPDRDPIGQEVLWGTASPSNPYTRIVGVVANVRYQAAESENGIELYYPVSQWPINAGYYVVRTADDPDRLGATVRRTIEEAEPAAAVAEVKTMERRMAESLWQQRLWGTLFAAFAALALGLAAVGLYGVMSHAVEQRRREIGIRMALGAAPSGVGTMVVREAMALVGGGLAVGIACALGVGRLIGGLLYGVAPYDPVIFGVVAAILCITALAAAWIPAMRASRVDPIIALRSD